MSNREEPEKAASAEGHQSKTKIQVEAAGQLFDAAAKTLGIAQLVSKQLDAGLGKALIDSASNTMELAQAQLSELSKKESEKQTKLGKPGSLFVTPAEENLSSSSKGISYGECDGEAKIAWRKNKRPFHDLGVGDELDGTKQCPVPKKSKIVNPHTRTASFTSTLANAPAASPSTTQPMTMPFSFGTVTQALPTGSVFGASCATAATNGSPLYQTSSFGTASTFPANAIKRKIPDQSSNFTISQASKTVIGTRKVAKASRKWGNVGAVKALPISKTTQQEQRKGVTSDSAVCGGVFASVKLTSSPAESKKVEYSNVSTSTFLFTTTSPSPITSSSSGISSDSKTKSDANVGSSNLKNNKQSETVMYEVRARRLKRVKNEWINCGAGPLRLYCHGRSYTMRHNGGRALFNVTISEGMLFHKVIKDHAKGKSAYVRFAAVDDVDHEVKTFLLQVKPRFVHELHETLIKLAKKI